MKKGKIIGATVALMVTATVAQAFEFKGAQVNLEYRDAQNGQSQLQLEASGALSFGSGFGAQAGIKNADYDTAGDGAFGFEAHLTYDLGTDVVLGAFAGKETFSSSFQYVGIEASYGVDAFGLEASWSKYSGSGFDSRFLTLDGSYGLSDKVSLLAGYHSGDGDLGGDYKYVGAGYDVTNGVSVSAKYGDGDFSGRVLSVGVGYTFGNGAAFTQRTYTNLMPAD
jgi:hypothetical protein